MALSISGYAGLLLAKLQAQSYNGHSFNGPRLSEFCTAVATGVVSISTGLTGSIAGPAKIGASAGVGITCDPSNIASIIKAQAVAAFGQEGPVLQQFCNAVGEATQEHFAGADLASDANGAAQFPSFSGASGAMASAIESAAGFTGVFWPDFALAIATGICQEIGSGGVGTLSGASGDGTGSGVVTIS